MHPRTPAGRFAAHGALLFLLPFATGCGPGAAGTAAVDDALAAQIQAARLPDGLLDSPELRRIVDLQVARDAEGLIAQLADGSPSVRARALHALASVQDSAAVPAILPLLRDPEWTVRRDAALALGQARTGVSASALLEALEREEGAEVRRRLTEALGKVGSAAALARLHDAAARPGEAAERMLAYARFGIRDVHHPAV
ncbi:MAG: HEAT repeat domain-containing protein, partial [Gemmatimonadota bacterium]